MAIEERTYAGVTVLDVDGRLSIETMSQMPLTVTVRRLLQAGQTRIVLNLVAVPYVDTTGMSNIVEAYLATTRRGGALKLLHLGPRVRSVLSVTGLLAVFEVFESEADAVASFNTAAS
jgi:anti-sigma B factor antagonist